MKPWDRLWLNVNLATMAPGEDAYGAIENGAIAVAGGRIAWLGKEQELTDPPDECALEVLDGAGNWVTPGLIDCHTHIVYGGNRAAEFEMRLEGASYEEIARAGGGIRSTVRATRAATPITNLDASPPVASTTTDDSVEFGLSGIKPVLFNR